MDFSQSTTAPNDLGKRTPKEVVTLTLTLHNNNHNNNQSNYIIATEAFQTTQKRDGNLLPLGSPLSSLLPFDVDLLLFLSFHLQVACSTSELEGVELVKRVASRWQSLPRPPPSDCMQLNSSSLLTIKSRLIFFVFVVVVASITREGWTSTSKPTDTTATFISPSGHDKITKPLGRPRNWTATAATATLNGSNGLICYLSD